MWSTFDVVHHGTPNTGRPHTSGYRGYDQNMALLGGSNLCGEILLPQSQFHTTTLASTSNVGNPISSKALYEPEPRKPATYASLKQLRAK